MPILTRLLVLLCGAWCALALTLCIATLQALLAPTQPAAWLALAPLGAALWSRRFPPPPDVLGRMVVPLMTLAALLAVVLALLAVLPAQPQLVDVTRQGLWGVWLLGLAMLGAWVTAVANVLDERQPHRALWLALGLATVLLGATPVAVLAQQQTLSRIPARLLLSVATVMLALAGPLLRRTSAARSAAFDTGNVHRITPGHQAPLPPASLAPALFACATVGVLASVWLPLAWCWPVATGWAVTRTARPVIHTPRLVTLLLAATWLGWLMAQAGGGPR